MSQQLPFNDLLPYQARFAEAIGLLCSGVNPPAEMVEAWLTTDDEHLQEFCITFGPDWAQGIAIIDAAHAIASQPPEQPMDMPDELWYCADAPKRAHSKAGKPCPLDLQGTACVCGVRVCDKCIDEDSGASA